MAPKKRIVDAKADKDGDITHVRFAGNKTWTTSERAIPMAERGLIENTHAVYPTDGRKVHLRTNPNHRRVDNLDDMAGDV